MRQGLEFLKSYLKRLILKKLAKFIITKIAAAVAPVALPVLLGLILFIIVYSVFFDLPNEYQANEGSLGFFTTGDSEWNLEKDKELMETYVKLSEDGISSEKDMDFGSDKAAPFTPAPRDQAGQFKLPWSLLASVDRMLGDPVMQKDRKARKPNPEAVYLELGPHFTWKDSTVTVKACSKDGCSTETYNIKLLTKAVQYDKISILTYQWETFSPSKGVTVRHEKLTGINSVPFEVTKLQALMEENGLPLDDDQFALELAARYDTGAYDLAANPFFDSTWGGANVPSSLIPIYKAASDKYEVPWNVLAAVHFVETTFGRNVQTSSSGSIGEMQFMPSTWAKYAVDADGDGKADPYNVKDAVFTAANYLSANAKAAGGNIRTALWQYNHADWYVNKVLAYADLFSGNTLANGTTGDAKKIIDTAYTYVGRVYYQLGGGRNEHDVMQNIFDCSSYVWMVFNRNGIKLGGLSGVTTKTLDRMGVEIPLSEIRPGDLIFFNTDGRDGHVGIYVGAGKFIGAQNSGCYVADVKWWSAHYGLGSIRRILNG